MGTRRAPSILDWLVVVALITIALIEAESGMFDAPAGVTVVFQLASLIPVAFRCVAPLPAIGLSALASMPYIVVYGAPNSLSQLLAGLVLIYSVGRHTDQRMLLPGAAIGLLLIVVEGLGGAYLSPADWAFAIIFSGAALSIGVAIRFQAERSSALALTAARALRDQEATAQAAVSEERARIARELHDVVAHNVGLIVLQAGGGRSVLASDPDRARSALYHIEETGRQTLFEMRHLVGILRVADPSDHHPLPRLERLPALLEEARAGGLTIDMDVQGTPVDLSAGLELAAYRLVQEALTNVRKHAPASHVKVRLGYEPDCLRVEVIDDGAARGTSADVHRTVHEPGHGLIGMRERVRLYDGWLQVGPTTVGGFRVEATLPLTLAST
jgi:signal transduction histidine kinase